MKDLISPENIDLLIKYMIGLFIKILGNCLLSNVEAVFDLGNTMLDLEPWFPQNYSYVIHHALYYFHLFFNLFLIINLQYPSYPSTFNTDLPSSTI